MISVDVAGAVAHIVLDRGAARNALDAAGWHGLAEAVRRVAASPARALIVAAAGSGAFCAGADLREIAALAGAPGERAGFRARMRAALDPLHALAIPTIAAIDGGCYGAGVALAVACDIRIAGPAARFAVTPARLGIGYPRQDVDRIRAAIGRAHAARLLLGAETIGPGEAARIGLVQIEAPCAIEAAEALAGTLAANAPSSVALLKAMLDDEAPSAGTDWDALFDAAFDGDDLREGLAAFHQRRPPRF